MADHLAETTQTSSFEPAESAFRRIARRKLLERGYPEAGIEAKIDQLLRTGLPIDPRLLDGP